MILFCFIGEFYINHSGFYSLIVFVIDTQLVNLITIQPIVFMSRDEFSKGIKEILAKRVGYLCSNPDCRRPTVGPNNTPDKSTTIGVAAHITAAAPGGPRFDDSLSNEYRSSIENGIWLCSNCASLIDKDVEQYPTGILKQWKQNAELESNEKLKGDLKNDVVATPYIDIDFVPRTSMRKNMSYSTKNPKKYEQGRTVYDISNNPIINWKLSWMYKLIIYNNSSNPAYNIRLQSIGESHFSYLGGLPKINNLPPLQKFEIETRYETIYVGTGDEAKKVSSTKLYEQLENIILSIEYEDEKRKTHKILVSFSEGIINLTR